MIPSSRVETLKSFVMSSTISQNTLYRWVTKEMTIDKAFVRLGLDHAGDNLLSHPKFAIWLKYVADLNAKNYRFGDLETDELLQTRTSSKDD